MKGMQKTCVLAVRDNEPSMGDDKDTPSEAAMGMGMCGTLGDYVELWFPHDTVRWLQMSGQLGIWGSMCCKVW